MRLHDSTLVLTPTDIANHLACRHLTQLDRARLAGERIELRQDPRIDALRHRGETTRKDSSIRSPPRVCRSRTSGTTTTRPPPSTP